MTGPPGEKPEIDYKTLADMIAAQIELPDEEELVARVTQEVIKQMPVQKIPESIQLRVYDKTTGESLVDQTYPLRGYGGVIDIQVPYQRSDMGTRSGQFQIQVQ